jgi:hypothetical protein
MDYGRNNYQKGYKNGRSPHICIMTGCDNPTYTEICALCQVKSRALSPSTEEMLKLSQEAFERKSVRDELKLEARFHFCWECEAIGTCSDIEAEMCKEEAR